MTRDDLRIFCTALGFTAVVMSDAPSEKQALRATNVARLIESFCLVTEPNSLNAGLESLDAEGDPHTIDRIIDRYKAELLDEESAFLPSDRTGLLKMYDRLLTRKTRHEQRDFYTTAHNATIANQILQLVEKEIGREQPHV